MGICFNDTSALLLSDADRGAIQWVKWDTNNI
jgi:hypothetical protein